MVQDPATLETQLQSRWENWVGVLNSANIDSGHAEVFIRAFKDEKLLEVWARDRSKRNGFQKIWTTPICAASGKPGPKRREGDHQVPEGMYHIAIFNPKSNFYLSLGLNYPNDSDRIFSDAAQPGSDIYIHGKCVSVGCLALGDEAIEQLYALTRQCKANGQTKLPVLILPCRMQGPTWQKMRSTYQEWKQFWEGLELLNHSFEANAMVPDWQIDHEGYYFIKK